MLLLLFYFQLSNGYYHGSLSSGPSLASVGAGPSPHIPSVSHAWTRASSSTLLPDYAHYYTIGPGMLPSSKIPSWKVCVSFVFCHALSFLSILTSTLLEEVGLPISLRSRLITSSSRVSLTFNTTVNSCFRQGISLLSSSSINQPIRGLSVSSVNTSASGVLVNVEVQVHAMIASGVTPTKRIPKNADSCITPN